MNRPALHVALTVHDLEASTRFYERLFGLPAAKRHHDYAKFEVSEPALVLSLNPGAPPPGPSRMSHLGIRVDSAQALDALEERLVEAGLPVRVEGETVCCYARARKLWVLDPDGNDWELYQFLEDAPEEQAPAAAPEGCCEPGGCG